MSGTEDSNHFWSSIFPSTFIYNELDEKALEKFINRQKVAKKYLPNPWAVVLLDDCMDDPKLFNKKLFQGIYKNSRHWSCFFIQALQYSMDVKPVIRNNIDGTFILREPNLRFRKSIYENYASVIPSFDLFCTLMDNLTQDYSALYVNNRSQSNNWQDCVYWYKGTPPPKNWKFGSDWYWQYHQDRYNPNYEDTFNLSV
jgi:hypothetical protein